jgi:hypothetical protein
MPYFRYSGGVGDPVKFVYAGSSPQGARIVAQSQDCGLRWYDESRGHDYFAHVFCEDSPKKLKADFNPMSLFLSPDIKTSFPAELKRKASEIMKGQRAREEPPLLDSFSSFSELQSNPAFSGYAVFSQGRLSQRSVARLSSAAAAIVNRLSNPVGRPLLFDIANQNSLNVMAAALGVIPPALRHSVSFATFAATEEIVANSPFATFTFVGVKAQSGMCDPDTGILGDLPDAGFEFSNAAEAAQFARIVNATVDVPGMDGFGALMFIADVVGKFRKGAYNGKQY